MRAIRTSFSTLVVVGGVLAAATALEPALGEPNGRPPPIKLGTPAPTPTPTSAPIKIGKPAPAPQGFGAMTPAQLDQMYGAILKIPMKLSVYQWKVNDQPVLMQPLATHVCLLTGVSGNFAGGGEHVTVGLDKGAAGGSRWVLSGTSGQYELRATATCAPKSAFTPVATGGGLHTWNLAPGVNTGCGMNLTYTKVKRPQQPALFIRDMAGKWRGGGEALAIAKNNDALANWACSGYVSGGLSAFGFSGAKGFDGDGPIKFLTNSGRTSTLGNANFTMTVEGGKETFAPFGGGEAFQGISGQQLAIPVNAALCGFVRIAGKFQGYGERAELVQSGGLWKLEVASQANQSYVSAVVRCIARDQR